MGINMKKVLSVIKGCVIRYNIKEITIIFDDEDRVIFSGDAENFLNPPAAMQNGVHKIKMMEAKRVLKFNNSKLFIFV
jgi:hypothetical protein